VNSPPTAHRIVSNQACSLPSAGASYPVANTRVLPILLAVRSATLQILPVNSAGQGSKPPFVTHGSGLFCVTKEPVCLSVCLSVCGSRNLQIIKDASSHFDSNFSMTVTLWHCDTVTLWHCGSVPNIIKIGICLILRLSIVCVSDQCVQLLYRPNAQNQTHKMAQTQLLYLMFC
jgi:hypothetical protein